MDKRRRGNPVAKLTVSRNNSHGVKCCHGAGWGLVLLIIGILFLLQDRAIWTFWGLSWYTVAFIIFGLGALLSKH